QPIPNPLPLCIPYAIGFSLLVVCCEGPERVAFCKLRTSFRVRTATTNPLLSGPFAHLSHRLV
ncbi:MAG: hypothetical protein KDI03_23745, partial [Anaerolineae bacterium]|nr:hypothetical protein [Anaerolineae bacterium]